MTREIYISAFLPRKEAHCSQFYPVQAKQWAYSKNTFLIFLKVEGVCYIRCNIWIFISMPSVHKMVLQDCCYCHLPVEEKGTHGQGLVSEGHKRLSCFTKKKQNEDQKREDHFTLSKLC